MNLYELLKLYYKIDACVFVRKKISHLSYLNLSFQFFSIALTI